jgi:tRNA(Ile2) C34 agmatinyltransferase TiaS
VNNVSVVSQPQQDYARMKGLCISCKVRYTWPRNTGRLMDSRCPKCGRRLNQTAHYAKGTWVHLERAPKAKAVS